MTNKKVIATLLAFLAAVFYAFNMPISKMLLVHITPTFMASFLYFGAGIGIGIIYLLSRRQVQKNEENLSKDDFPYTLGMISLDIAAPILLMAGLMSATSANASLLNNFEIVATSLIALLVFKEIISVRLWIAILLITLSSMLLTVEDVSSFRFSYGSLFVLAAAICWGLENNFTRKLSRKNTFQIVILKGLFSGIGSFIIALVKGDRLPQGRYIVFALVLGFFAYGLSIFLYVKAQRNLGAAKTSAYYAIAPFIGALLSFVILRESVTANYFIALFIMMIGSGLVVMDTLMTKHTHVHTHIIINETDGVTSNQHVEHSHPHTHRLSNADHSHHRHKEKHKVDH